MKFKFKHFNIFWKEALLFTLTQVLGIFVAIRVSKVLEALEIKPEPINLSNLLIYFVVITLVILAFLKISKKGSGVMLQIFFVLAVFSGLDILFGTFTGEPTATILAAGLIILRFVRPTVWLHNLVVIGGLAGIGAMLGITLLPRDAIILLIILAVYDVIAVYKTKHMVKMAKAMIKKRVILGIIIPEKILGLKASMADVEQDKIPVKRILKPGERGKFMILGGGDLVLPLLLIASVANQNIWQSVIILIFALLGLLAMHLLFIKLKSKPMPALPPLAVFSILGYLVSLLI
jgi:presenilin-like A22 family membrane protease